MAGILLLIAVPTWVASPSNVSNVVLSPVFWPNTLAGVAVLIGLGLLYSSTRLPRVEADAADVDDVAAAWVRLALLACLMLLTIFVVAHLGLVWTAMLIFAATAVLVRTSHPRTALICALLVPLVLYVFFAHVAGVAIPQGDFVRLP